MQRVEVQAAKKKHAVPIACQKIRQNRSEKVLLQFPDQPSHILGSTENTTFVHLPKKSKYLKAVFFVISSNIVLASEWTTSRNQLVLQSIYFDRFMTSEGTDTLISAFTSKTGQSVARYTHRFFIRIFQSERGYIYAFYKPNFKLHT